MTFFASTKQTLTTRSRLPTPAEHQQPALQGASNAPKEDSEVSRQDWMQVWQKGSCHCSLCLPGLRVRDMSGDIGDERPLMSRPGFLEVAH